MHLGDTVVEGDAEPFDPAPWLTYPAVVLFWYGMCPCVLDLEEDVMQR